MNLNGIAEHLWVELESRIAGSSKKEIIGYVEAFLEELLENNTDFEDAIVQIDLDCGELKNVKVTNPKLVYLTVVTTENPAVADDRGDGVYIDDDCVITDIRTPELIGTTYNVRRGIELFEDK